MFIPQGFYVYHFPPITHKGVAYVFPFVRMSQRGYWHNKIYCCMAILNNLERAEALIWGEHKK